MPSLSSALVLILARLALVLGQPHNITLGCQLYTSADHVTVRGGPGEARTAFQLAIDEINASGDLLPDTVLLPMYRNTNRRESAIEDAIDLLSPDENGHVCSSLASAETTRRRNAVAAPSGFGPMASQIRHQHIGLRRKLPRQAVKLKSVPTGAMYQHQQRRIRLIGIIAAHVQIEAIAHFYRLLRGRRDTVRRKGLIKIQPSLDGFQRAGAL